jgi:diguanylate cyclase (GGDEF)-like protein
MSKIISLKRDLMTIMGFIMLGICVLGLGVLSAASVKENQLMHDGEAEVRRWATELTNSLQSDPQAAQDTFLSHNFFLKKSSISSRIFAFDVFDENGKLFHSAGPSDWYPVEAIANLLNSPVTRYRRSLREQSVQLHAFEENTPVTNYASIAMPFYSEKGYIGSIIAFVDQGEQASFLTHSFTIIAGMTGLLLLIGVGVPSLLVLARTKEHVKAKERIRYLSVHDEMTGLANRKSFNSHLCNSLTKNKRRSGNLVVVIIDIDRFKQINDALGHSAGDSVLRYITELLKSNIHDGDHAARIGSDQFALTLSGVKGKEQAVSFVATLSEALSAPFWIDGEQVSCTVSMGCAVAPERAGEATILMRHANLALDRAKSDGGNAFKFFEQGMDTAFIRRRDCEADLRRAIDSDQFELNYQPLVDLKSQQICGYEALIRWNHPRDGSVSPGFFIPLAEETELIIPIGEWVLRQSCRDAAAWPKPLKVSVNLSPVQFKRGNIVKLVKGVLEETGLDPKRLEVEITESLLISSTGKVAEDLDGLRALGVSIAMDDFGTGYSSLSYISCFPFNKIKIDQSFVQSMTKDKAILGIVKCIIAMGHSLGVIITAEGVETPEQNRILKGLGCEQVQGYLYGRPISSAMCTERIGKSLKITAKKPAGKRKVKTAA